MRLGARALWAPALLTAALLAGCGGVPRAAEAVGARLPADAAPDPLVRADSLLGAGDYAAAVRQASPVLQDADTERQTEAYRIVGLARFQLQEYALAADALEIVARRRNGSDDWFNVATSATLARQVDRGRRAYDEAVARGRWERLNSAQAPFYYAFALRDVGAYEQALDPLTELRAVYAALSITDDTFLYIRGVPFLSDTLELATEIFQALGRPAEGRAWMEELIEAVDPEGQALVARYAAEL